MHVKIVRPGDLLSERVELCIVVDVLRATTTAAVLCERLGEICVVRTPADLGQLTSRPGGYALFSELAGVDSDMPRFDNSPTQARSAPLAGRRPVLVTTNGTLAVGIAAGFADEVVLAGFVNLSAVVRYVRARAVASVAVLPAGNIHRARRCIEDDGCAGSIAALLTGEASDVESIIAGCRVDTRIMQRRATEPGLGADIDLCFDVDAVPVVPHVVGGGEQGWFDVVTAALG